MLIPDPNNKLILNFDPEVTKKHRIPDPNTLSDNVHTLAWRRGSNMSDWESSVLKSALPARIRPANR
jgi:hypothetical protein